MFTDIFSAIYQSCFYPHPLKKLNKKIIKIFDI